LNLLELSPRGAAQKKPVRIMTKGGPMNLIRRNQRQKALAILDNAKDIRSYTLDNGFIGKPCDPLDYKGEKWLIKEWIRHAFAKLGQMGDNKFTLEIHSNCWYEFTN